MRKAVIAGPFSNLVMTKQLIIFLLLGFLVLAQSLGIIYIKQTKRSLHSKLQRLYAARDKLQVEWSQLLLEKGTWESEARVERVAREQLGMVVPEKVNVIIP
jgi:cell division protein FtsL